MTGHGQPVMENEPVSVRTPGEHLYKKRIVDYNYTDKGTPPDSGVRRTAGGNYNVS